MKKILIIFIVILSSFSSYAWIDSVYWNRSVAPHTLRAMWTMNQGTDLKIIDQYFINGSDTVQVDFIFRDCYGPASSYDFDSTIIIPTSISKPNYCIVVRIIFDSNSILNNCYKHDRLISREYMDCNAPLSVDEITYHRNGIQILPNPVRDKLKIDSGKKKVNTIFIYNLFGKLIRKEKYQDGLDVSELPSGTYLVAMQTDKEVEWRKFLKE